MRQILNSYIIPQHTELHLVLCHWSWILYWWFIAFVFHDLFQFRPKHLFAVLWKPGSRLTVLETNHISNCIEAALSFYTVAARNKILCVWFCSPVFVLFLLLLLLLFQETCPGKLALYAWMSRAPCYENKTDMLRVRWLQALIKS